MSTSLPRKISFSCRLQTEQLAELTDEPIVRHIPKFLVGKPVKDYDATNGEVSCHVNGCL